MNYPAMLYRKGILSGDPKDQRTVATADEELAASAEGFKRWESKPEQKAGKTAPDVAAAAAFDSAAARAPKAGKGGKAEA